MRVQITRVFAGVLVLLAACTSAKPNVEGEVDLGPPPVAATQAAALETVPLGALVTLDGSASSDPDGRPLQFDWRMESAPSGSGTAVSAPSAAQTTFLADVPGTFSVRLTVSNGKRWSQPSVFSFKVEQATAIPGNSPPIAKITSPAKLEKDIPAIFDASGSSDPEGKTLSYAWELIARPKGSKAALQDATAAQTSFIPDLNGMYKVRLMVRDDRQPSKLAKATMNLDSRTWEEKLGEVSFRLNAQRTNFFEGGDLKPPLRRRWQLDMDKLTQETGVHSWSYPLVTEDSVYFAVAYHIEWKREPELWAFDLETGEQKWPAVKLCSPGGCYPSEMLNHPGFVKSLVYSHGFIYTLDVYGDRLAINASDGSARLLQDGPDFYSFDGSPWNYVAPAMVVGGKIIATGQTNENANKFVAQYRRMYVYDEAEGHLLATATPTSCTDSATATWDVYWSDLVPAFSGHTAYLGGVCGELTAFDVESGRAVWDSERVGCGGSASFVQNLIAGDDFLVSQIAYPAGGGTTGYYCRSDGQVNGTDVVYDLNGKVLRRWAHGTQFAVHGQNGIHGISNGPVNDGEFKAWLESVNLTSGEVNWRVPLRPERFKDRAYDPLIVNGVVYYVGGMGSLQAFDELTGRRIWFDEPPEVNYISKVTAPYSRYWKQTSTNGEVLVVANNYGFIVYEPSPEPPDESYKTRCDAPGKQFYVEGDVSRVGANGLELADGNESFQGSLARDESNATISATAGTGVQLDVSTTEAGNSMTWRLNFRPKSGSSLAEQSYPDPAVEDFFEAAYTNTPPLSVSGPVQVECASTESRFEITSLQRDAKGLQKFSANFEQHCGKRSAALRGCVKWERPTP
jgi:hypothetical protein